MISDEKGSIAPLGIGLAMLVSATLFAVSEASSLFIFQRRLTSAAEFAALGAVTYDTPAIDLIARSSRISDARVVKDVSIDGLTHEVTVCATWNAPLRLPFLPSSKQLCGSGSARLG